MSKLAEEAELNVKTLYRTLSAKGNPELKSLKALLKAIGNAAYGPSPPQTCGLNQGSTGVL